MEGCTRSIRLLGDQAQVIGAASTRKRRRMQVVCAVPWHLGHAPRDTVGKGRRDQQISCDQRLMPGSGDFHEFQITDPVALHGTERGGDQHDDLMPVPLDARVGMRHDVAGDGAQAHGQHPDGVRDGDYPVSR